MRKSLFSWKPLQVCALTAALAAVAFPCARAQDVPAATQSAMASGAKYEAAKQFPAAADSYRAAAKAGGHCSACLQSLARVQMAMELYKDVAATAAQLVAMETDGPAKARAELLGSEALFQQYFAQSEGRGAIEKDPRRAAAALKQAETASARGVADDPANEAVRMLHGRVLAAMKRDEDASREFNACAALPGTSPEECARALRFAKDTGSARGEPAPSFKAQTLDGKTVSLDSLAGKVVLIDFWATWCKYCERDSDYVQSMMGTFENTDFVLLEVSVDENESAWRHYVKEKRLEGVQTRDGEKDIAGAFHVSGFPTYVVLDGSGTVRLRAVGTEEGDLKGTVRKLLAESQPAAPDTRQKLSPSGKQGSGQ